MPKVIPIPTPLPQSLPNQPQPLPFFDLQVPLEGVIYTLQMRWNVRALAWFLTVLDDTGDTVLAGDVKMVADFPLYVHRRQLSIPGVSGPPPGFFLLRDTTNQHQDPGFVDLGQRHQLWYFTKAELPA